MAATAATAGRSGSEDWSARLDRWYQQNQRLVRLVSVWSPVLAAALLVSRSTPFRRLSRTRDLPPAWVTSHRKLRGRVCFAGHDGTFSFYHTPFLRNALWFDVQVVGERHCLPCRVGAVQMVEGQRDAFVQTVNQRDVYVQLIRTDKDVADVVLFERGLGYVGANIGEAMLENGTVTLASHSTDALDPSRVLLEQEIPQVWKRYAKAEKYARKHRHGVWAERVPESRGQMLQRVASGWLSNVVTDFRTWLKK